MRYDLIVLGNDVRGQQSALAAAELRKRVALVMHRDNRTGRDDDVSRTISSAALREAALQLTGIRHCESTMDEWRQRSQAVVAQETVALETQLRERDVRTFVGRPRFHGPHDIDVVDLNNESHRLRGDKILIAVGSRPLRPSWVPFDGETILDSDEVLNLNRLPKSMIVVGGDVLGLEYAMIFALLGTRVTIVDARPRLLEFCDREGAELIRQRAVADGIRFRLGRSVRAIEKTLDHRAVVRMEGDKNLIAECVLYVSGRRGETDSLNLAAAHVTPDEKGRLWCNEHGQTWVKHIYGIGDVVGFPALASQWLDQCRRAVHHAFGQPVNCESFTPHGLHTIPELAMVGATEQQLDHDLVAYEAGVCRFRDTTRGQTSQPAAGMLKLLFHIESLQLLGVHCLGKAAHELIRLGQTVLSLGGTIKDFREESIQDSALFDCYRLAAEDGMRRLQAPPATPQPALRVWRPKPRRRLTPNMS